MKKLFIYMLVASTIISLASCKKNNLVVDKTVIPPAFAKFMSTGPQRFDVTSTNTSLKIPIGVTNVGDVDRTVKVTTSSSSGAQVGVQFNTSSTITIPAGKTIDSLPVSAIFSAYQTGRKDTIVFTIVDDQIKASDYNNKYTLYMYGPCFEGNVVLNSFIGSYPHTNENFGGSPYGPYTTTVSTVHQTSATTGTVTITNIYDYGWNPITVNLDWTDPYNVTAIVPQQSGIGDAGTLSSSYAGMDISVRQSPGTTGTYSYCSLNFDLKMQVGVTGLGWFGSLYEVVVAK